MNIRLHIDEAAAAEKIVTELKRVYEENNSDGVLIGLSGGIDSAVLAALAVRSLGSTLVHAVYLYDQHSDDPLRRSAGAVARWLGIELEEISIEPAMREMGVYSSPAMKVVSLSRTVNRLLHRTYRVLFRESPFISSLKSHSNDSGGRRWFRAIIRGPEEAMNARHKYRRRLLEEKAAGMNWLLPGAANRTEWMVGWFVKGGIDDLSFQPLKGLYKTQVRQLAVFLDIPAEVRAQTPSPDMIKGITDEFALGLNYEMIDLILSYIEGGPSRDEVISGGCSEEDISLVRDMNRLSAWKRVP